MFKNSLKGKLLILTGAILLLGACKEESKDLSKLDATFSEFVQEQKALAEQEAKIDRETQSIIASEKKLPAKAQETTSQDTPAPQAAH